MAIVSLVLALLLAGVGEWVVSKLNPDLDPSARWGLGGLLGLGLTGTLLMPISLVPGGTTLALPVGLIVAAAGTYRIFATRSSLQFQKPEGPSLLFVLGLAVPVLFSWIGSFAPSTSLDWDSLAYHLAVPKLWLTAGHAYSVPNLSHSNFPAAIDNLFLIGLQLGGQAGAKQFLVASFFFGVLAIFGLARQANWSDQAKWWAALAFASIPMVIWESGTAYIDVPHGLYAGLGLWLAIHSLSRRNLFLAALFLSLAVGTKYTGFLSIFVASATLFIGSGITGRGWKHGFLIALTLGVASVLLSSLWSIRNVVWTGNPVYPFFYSKLGGKSWDERHAKIYTHEQNTFGVGRPSTKEQPDQAENPLQVGRMGYSIAGLAIVPGRFTNPGQTLGMGFAFASIGAPIILALFGGLAFAKPKSLLGVAVIGSLLTMVAWFALSQQSRYILAIAPVLALTAGWLTTKGAFGQALKGLVALQLLYSLGLLYTNFTSDQIQVDLGKISQTDYQAARISFAKGADAINELPKESKIALYDEVFGYLLDRPYIWANPGHGKALPYDDWSNGDEWAAGLQKLGFTHVYMNLVPAGSSSVAGLRWVQAAGLQGLVPYSAEERASLLNSFELKFKALSAEAAAKGLMKPVKTGRTWVLFELVPNAPK